MKNKFIPLLLGVLVAACSSDSVLQDPVQPDVTARLQTENPRLIEMKVENFTFKASPKAVGINQSKDTGVNQSTDDSVRDFMVAANIALQASGLQISAVEYYSIDGAGNTVFFEDRGNKQLSSDFVPGDPRRGGFTDIAYALDGTEGATASGLSQGDTDAAILSAMNTWDNVTCSAGLDLFFLGSSGFDLGYIAALIGTGGSFFFTDLMHSGFNTDLFNVIFGPGSSVLGVTFTLIWVDSVTGEPTDIDNNNKTDVALRDIYYNDAFSWAIGANIDVETVALHEAGHGLSQAHFGKLSQNNNTGAFQFSPRAVMNAGYTGVQTIIEKTDKAGHCSNWAQWPNN